MVCSKLFVECIPKELALQMFSHVGLTSLHDSRWFRKKDIEMVMSKIEEELPLLEPYYLPHRKFYLTRSMSGSRIACIFRQIARCLGLSLEASERSRYGEKQTYYRLVSQSFKPLDAEFTVVFV